MKLRTKIIQSLIHINEAIFFYPKLKKFYKDNLKNASVSILDVGANKGQSIDFFLGINPNAKITAFEPNKKLYHLLGEKYMNNGNIILNNLGVSNFNGELEFNENILDETSTFESLNLDSKYLEKKAKVLGVTKEAIIVDKYKVAVITLSEFLKSNENSSFDVLKIDVEGHELQVLEGLFSNGSQFNIRLIQLESHNDDMYLRNSKHEDIDQILNKNGYFEITKIKHGFGDFAEIIYENKNK
jgi:FkbM family methyltransferase